MTAERWGISPSFFLWEHSGGAVLLGNLGAIAESEAFRGNKLSPCSGTKWLKYFLPRFYPMKML